MKSTIVGLVVAALLIGTIAGASALYKNLGDEYNKSNGPVGGLEVFDDSLSGNDFAQGAAETKKPSTATSLESVATDAQVTENKVTDVAAPTTTQSVPNNPEPQTTEQTTGQTTPPPEPEQQKITLSVPDFEVLDSNGNKVKLSDFAGRPIVINFWASWCYYCKVEMPDFDKAYKNHPDVVFLMVNDTDGASETLASAKAFVESGGYSFDVYFDTTGEAFSAYGITSYPSTYFINANGELVARRIGMLDYSMLEQGISYITP